MAEFHGTDNPDFVNPRHVSYGVIRSPSFYSMPSDESDTIYGHGGYDDLDGGGGDDHIYTGAGSDTAYGGLGNDYIEVDDYYDYYYPNGTLLYGGLGNDIINGYVSEDEIYGEGGVDYLSGGSLDDLLDGGTGADEMRGGSGGDTYVVDSVGDYVEDVVENYEYPNGEPYDADDRVNSSITYTINNLIENLTLTGSSTTNGTGNNSDNHIVGNSAANTLLGLVGADSLEGFGGDDSLDGGAGVDTMYGGAGNDVYYADLTTDVAVEEFAGTTGGVDTVYATTAFTLGANVETLALVGTTAANGTGNGANNNLYGNSLVNTLRGLGGADTFRSGNGADVLIGGSGNDLFQYLTVTGSTPASRDVVRAGDGATAFQGAGAALGDRFDFALIDANTTLAGVQDFGFGKTTGKGRLWAATSGSNTMIRGNTDNDAAAELEIVVQDGTVLASAYSAADFLL